MATIDIDIDMSVLKRKLKATEDKIKQGVENLWGRTELDTTEAT